MKTIRKAELRWRRVALVGEEQAEYGKKVSTSSDVEKIVRALIGDEVHEVFIVLHLDNKGGLVGYSEASRGGLCAAALTPADVFRSALLAAAASVIVAHNHPSGDCSPSPEDLAFTRRLERAGEVLGVKLLDHVIIGDGCYSSLLDMGLLRRPERQGDGDE